MDDSSCSPELPEPIIHRVQSLLTSKEAAQTTLLSKSWDKAWSTRPTIDLDESNYFSSHLLRLKVDRLAEFARKTFQRYEESDQRIDTFRLFLNSEIYARYGLATEWTVKALKLGATDLTIRIRWPEIAVPLDEAFASENVVRLCLQGSYIDQLKVIKCWGLKSLALSEMPVSSDSIIKVLSCCPLIESLSLSGIRSKNQYHHCFENDEQQQQGVMVRLLKLTSLVLCRLEYPLQTLFLDDLSSKFPILKNLTMRFCLLDFVRPDVDQNDTQIISSPSLQILNFSVDNSNPYNSEVDPYNDELIKMPRINFDVPSIRKFTFEGSCMPELSFMSTSRDQWESHVSLTEHARLSITWFLKLSKFLMDLRLSKIHLCLHVHNSRSFHYQAGEIKCLSMPEVENLIMDTRGLPSLSFNALLDGLFRICRPKMITQYASPVDDGGNMDMPFGGGSGFMGMRNVWNVMPGDFGGDTTINNDEFLFRALEHGMELKNSLILPSQYMYGLRHLDEINVQMLMDEVWSSQPLDSILLDYSTSEQRRFRIHLQWKPS